MGVGVRFCVPWVWQSGNYLGSQFSHSTTWGQVGLRLLDLAACTEVSHHCRPGLSSQLDGLEIWGLPVSGGACL